jgi:hypothetical protein
MVPILSDKEYEELDIWMEYARMLKNRYSFLGPYMQEATYPIFRDFYQERGINPAGKPIKGAK